jgi:hypothetical protein
MEAHSYEADKRVRDIQRATRRQFSAEEKREVAMTREEAIRYVSYQLDDALLAQFCGHSGSSCITQCRERAAGYVRTGRLANGCGREIRQRTYLMGNDIGRWRRAWTRL